MISIPKLLRTFCASGVLMIATTDAAQDPIEYVDPEIGTAHSRWFFYTPAAVPQGMAKLAPSTNGHEGNPSGWEAVGYDSRHDSIAGFVHFHEWQIGGVTFMPTTGELKTVPGSRDDPESGYRSRFDRGKQIAQPGFYQVHLSDTGIDVELRATKRVGFHRYTFPKSADARIILDIGNKQGESGEVIDASIRMIDGTHFEGFVKTLPRYIQHYDPSESITMYFHGELDRRPSRVGAFNHDRVFANKSSISGKGAGLFLNYSTHDGEQLGIKVGLSYTSIANAKNNLRTEAAGLTFDEAKSRAQAEWRQELGRIQVFGRNEDDKTKFYTGLFHALLGRGTASDANGDYPKSGGKVGRSPAAASDPGRQFLNTDAVWGAYWDLTQLWALSYHEWYSSYVYTQLKIHEDKGWFGDGIANSAFASGVGTNMVGLVIAGAYQTGLLDPEFVHVAYEAIKKNELGWKDRPIGAGKADVKTFLESGYVPFLDRNIDTDAEGSRFSASHTLEYAFSAFAAAQMARDLGKGDDYRTLLRHSTSWRNVFNPENKLIHPKTLEGEFIDNFDPKEAWRGFQEGNAVQYTFFVPHDPAGLIEAIGEEEFNDRLNRTFEISEKDGFSGGETVDAFAGVQSFYNHGNQPCLHISWLFNFSGRPWLTQKWTRRICETFYGTDPVHGYGRGQDEDQGQLGAWYVIAALGLFDVKGLTDSRPTVQLGSPVFEKAVVALRDGKELVIETKNNLRENVYVQSARFNDKPLPNCWVYWDELMQGGTLEFVMGKEPNKKWGVETRPPSATLAPHPESNRSRREEVR